MRTPEGETETWIDSTGDLVDVENWSFICEHVAGAAAGLAKMARSHARLPQALDDQEMLNVADELRTAQATIARLIGMLPDASVNAVPFVERSRGRSGNSG